jgi:hypothetical protein
VALKLDDGIAGQVGDATVVAAVLGHSDVALLAPVGVPVKLFSFY